ncbi:menaquinone reductase molybdopterin-binding-like subunit QrcB [Desulfococcus sp.]|uniref:menaquinone reductase molybdopterin-binding-like subunit QrcB n=1 Tax=Desulfococcus sp. TaxID=2025834 RepID=UPI00359377E2
MKIDRRSFLSLGIGAAAGTALSPLPWKLTDDLSIWTQMWPWTPVPKRGEVNIVNSVSTLCAGGCGISVRKVEDRAVKIEGMKGYPGNDGKACIHCLSGLQLLYGPTAVRSPLKRVGERGEGKWQKISWDAAVAEIAEKIGTLREKGRPDALACITDRDHGTVPELFKRLMKAHGSPNFMRSPSFEDTYELALKLMQGVDASVGFDLENADYILSLGSGILDGWGSSVRMFKAKGLWLDKKAKVVQAEARLSNSAAKADQWIPVEAGTEAVLALGIAHVIIKEGLYKKNFTDSYGFGFEDWVGKDGKKHDGFKSIVLKHYAPNAVAGITRVDPDVIVEIATAFAKASHPLALCGRGQGLSPGALHEVMAVHALNALVGNINQKGGVWAVPLPDYVKWPEPKLDGIAEKGLAAARIDGAGSERYPHAKYILTRLPAVINEAEASPVEVLFVSGANPCYTLPDARAAKAVLSKIPFIVSFASHMDETALMADLILPNHGHLERYEDFPVLAGMNTPLIGLCRPVVQPRRNTRHTGDALLMIAKAVGGPVADAFPWESYQECLEQTMGANWQPLLENGFIHNPEYKPEGWDASFKTPSGKFAFMSDACAIEGGEDAVVHIEGKPDEFPLALIPYDAIRLAGGATATTPFVLKTVDDTVLLGTDIFVEVNTKTGGKCGLEEGVYANLTTPKGTVKVRVHLSEGIVPGVVAMPRGLGHAEIESYVGGKGINVNDLIGPVEDPVSGLDAAWGIRANLTIA